MHFRQISARPDQRRVSLARGEDAPRASTLRVLIRVINPEPHTLNLDFDRFRDERDGGARRSQGIGCMVYSKGYMV